MEVQWFILTLSLPNATVVELTVHCQTRLQSKFKGTVDTCLFLAVIRNANLCSLFQTVQGHTNIVYGRLHNFLYKNGLNKSVCNVIRFCGRQKQRKHVQENDIQDAF